MSTNGWLTIEQRYSLDPPSEDDNWVNHPEDCDCIYCVYDDEGADTETANEEEDESEVC